MEGQLKLKAARVLMVGAGGLGCPVGMYLNAAGVGTIGVIDYDVVDNSNLQRQIAFTVADVGKSKAECFKRSLQATNPNTQVDVYNEKLSNDNAIELFSQYDVIIDGTDNFNTRYLVSDAAYLAGKPLVYGSIYQFQGQMTVFTPGKTPCYRCLYASPPPAALVPNCAEGGVLGYLPGIVGLIQTGEVIKLIIGKGKTLESRLLLFDALRMRFKEVNMHRNPECVLCGARPTVTELQDYDTFCNVQMPGEEDGQFDLASHTITAPELEEKMEDGDDLLLVDVREPNEWDICHLEDAELMPMSSFDSHLMDLDEEQEIVLYCHVGERSEKALIQLLKRGFKNVKHLDGGIDRWSEIVDPSMPRY